MNSSPCRGFQHMYSLSMPCAAALTVRTPFARLTVVGFRSVSLGVTAVLSATKLATPCMSQLYPQLCCGFLLLRKTYLTLSRVRFRFNVLVQLRIAMLMNFQILAPSHPSHRARLFAPLCLRLVLGVVLAVLHKLPASREPATCTCCAENVRVACGCCANFGRRF